MKTKMKIGYVVPVPLYWDVQEETSRGELLKEWAFPNTEVNFVIVTEGPITIETKYEGYLSVSATAKEIVRLEKEGYDAAILGCAADPGLDAMREITTKMLVVGLGDAYSGVSGRQFRRHPDIKPEHSDTLSIHFLLTLFLINNYHLVSSY